ncbi:TPA: hypothetical protein CPT92_08740 [Candidatus Gastranaerophilales bacterium HUM_13]|jgi:hypothetical protein|nr:MAG TPA: hypothetical protein CPT92_08740 [Candidatus Gastranaerophilales bacterium HUM_13]DAB10723.1 MAG TPA: hypothetical protein CPT95_01830 [Candidatus Gastranaerophilales bacterium HUM_15]
MQEELLYRTYYEKIFPLIEDIEIYRRELCNQLIWRSVLFSSIFSVLLGMIVYFQERNVIYASSLVIVSMIVFLTANFLNAPQKKLFSAKLKDKFFYTVIKSFTQIDLWQKNRKESEIIPYNELIESGLFSDFTYSKNDDEFRGVYKGVQSAVSERECFFQTPMTEPSIVFKGLIIKFKSNKRIAQRTIIASKRKSPIKFLLAFIVTVLCLSFRLGIENILNSVVAGVVVASVLYFTTSEDEVEARYLLTPTFIEKFSKLKKVMKADTVKCSFYNNSIMIAVRSEKDFFELGNLFKNVSDLSTIENFYRDISIIFELIEYFKLDVKIGL